MSTRSTQQVGFGDCCSGSTAVDRVAHLRHVPATKRAQFLAYVHVYSSVFGHLLVTGSVETQGFPVDL